MIEKNVQFNETDPKNSYEIVNQIGMGGFSCVYKVKNKLDGKFYALKFITPKEKSEVKVIKNEIALMKECHEDDYIL